MAQGRRERRDEPGAVTLRPPEVATMGAAHRVGGLLLRHVLELDLSTAARDLGAKVTDVLERRGAICRVGNAGQLHVAQPGGGRPLEVGRTGIVVALKLR